MAIYRLIKPALACRINPCFSLASHLHFHHVDGVPAPLDLLGSITGLLDENDSSEATVQVPQIHRRHATFKVAVEQNQRSKDKLIRVLYQTTELPLEVLTGLCTGQRLYWLQPQVSSGELKELRHLQLEVHIYYSMGT